ncbi:MAG: aminotransferase class I/II-fold pyridoxal phosphate-dependent enzyme [Candidatus Levybacteria bacterium]|nr:aminotransferase class I/II-fold pyridoxal phosphate-dependent enzyme [Candidatus Levybacteria bacterium]MBI2420923.1 aminotransferase class I/II-fold pyridoxal phosphate-dependent enzyme [Candidatus Levybacteria bacterium]
MDRRATFYKKIEEEISKAKIPHVIDSGEGAYLTINGKNKLNFCSSHYLGFAVNPRLAQAASNAVYKYGIGTGYRTLAGNHRLHLELEEVLARFKKAEAAIVLTGGYMANCAAISTIIGKEDIVISDELNHASIIDAIRLSQVKNKLIYKHLDISDLENKLKEAVELAKAPKSDGQTLLILVITDGVFSMDGDLAPLPEIVRLAHEYGALTMVDDAHGEGVLGNGGRGIVDHFGLHGQVDIEVGTLSKAFSVIGGFITGKKELITFYKQKSRQYLFSNALTIPDTAALIEAVKILEESDELVKKLWDNAKYLKSEFARLGFDTGHSKTPITPVMIPDEEKAREFSASLFELDVFATPIVFPMVAKGKARIRVIPSASHSRQDLDKGIAAFEKAGKDLNII